MRLARRWSTAPISAVTVGTEGLGIAVDAAGDAYVTGYALHDFPTTAGAFQTIGHENAFVTKLNAAGTALVYSTYLGGNSWDEGCGIAVDAAGEAYVTGLTESSSFPTTAGAFQTSYGGGSYDAFVTKLNAAGTALVYSTYLGGNSWDEGCGIAVDAAGEAYVTGYTESTNFPTTAGAFQTNFGGGNEDAFVAKLNAAGTAPVYSTYLSGKSSDYGYGIAVDAAGNAYVIGTTFGNFPTTPGAFQTSFGGGENGGDAFVTKLDAAGTALVYSTYLGGNNTDCGYGIAVDAAGDAYVTGYTDSTNFPATAGAFQTSLEGSEATNAFVTKFTLAATTTLTFQSGSGVGTYGGTTSLTATLMAGPADVPNETVAFRSTARAWVPPPPTPMEWQR